MTFARVIQHCARIYETVTRANQGRPFEIEVCVDQTAAAASPLEHLFLGLELEARQIRVTSLGLRFADAPSWVDNPAESWREYEEKLRGHMAVARFCGPYKLSFRGGEEMLGGYPIIGRLCGDQLHVKTSTTSYLEGLRAVARLEPKLLAEIILFSGAGDLTVDEMLDDPRARKLMYERCGEVLAQGKTAKGESFRRAITEALNRRPEGYEELLALSYDRQIRALNAG